MSGIAAFASAAVAAGLLALSSTAASAQALVKATDFAEVEINRDIRELEPILRPPPDHDSTDTALVFHNPRGWTALVRCVGFNHNGTPVGRIALKIPGNGLRFALA